MNYPEPYITYLLHFHGDRDYFECHEVLEEYWKEVAPGERESHWVGLIQIAVAFYHYRRINFKGALTTMKKAVSNLKKKRDEITDLGLDHNRLISILEKSIKAIDGHIPYQSVVLPIADPALIEQCETDCKDRGFIWCAVSNMDDQMLIHRHSLRDRTEVIMERKRQLTLKNEQN
ncbi:DUF309 domain-containing protein [Bacillus sp. CECT 9360]|uniref:DUF309 domain-containing protein n=1 Tax=Bacillus sp. CECT 9360 TaxID=2845821 RepID=UPI001E550A67|nr:DUF309 domain-containing protein [Bacillus sp. CECT 9360]CAH0345603.1 hypothetical protein BCI9360_01895 [Bacillus sp. CECT 9360]